MSLHNNKHLLGRWAEKSAQVFLEGCGYECLVARYRKAIGEIDLIMQKDQLLVFVEVKARSSAGFGRPEEAVDRRKLLRMRRVARHFLHERQAGMMNIRFDVVAVDFRGEGRGYVLRHIRGVI